MDSLRGLGAAVLVVVLAACSLTQAPTTTPTAIPLQPPTATAEQAATATLALTSLVNPSITPLAGVTATPALGGERPSSLQSAVIIAPATGSTVSGNPLQLNGVVYGLPQDSFVLELLNNLGTVINQQTITLRNPNNAPEVSWSAALMTQYRGAAVVRLVARDRQGSSYVAATVSITIGEGGGNSGNTIPQTTNAPFAVITQPVNSATVAGNPIQVSGSAGGIFENVFTLELRAANNTLLNSQNITLTSSDPSLVVPWAASLGTSGYMGQAELRVVYLRPSDGQSQALATAVVTLN
jgi:hypothetical protein